MKAKLTLKDHNGKIASNRKEKGFVSQYTIAAISKGLMFTPVIARFYSTPSRSYCCIWLCASHKDIYLSGGGKAGGYGYHRASQALYEALSDCGVTLDADIAGRGDTAMRDALVAVAQALGFRNPYIFEAHA